MKSPSSQSPASAAGILYQFERALHWLATEQSPDAVVGIETADDIATDTVLEQDKLSFQKTGHPFQDRSIALWKTLGIWLDAAGTSSPFHKTAQLHLVTNRPVTNSAIVRRLAKTGQTEDELADCIKLLRDAGKDPRKTLKPHATRVLSYGDAEMKQVVRRIELFDAACGTKSEDMRERVLSSLHVPPGADTDSLIYGLRGWLHDVVYGLWAKGEPAWVSRRQFDTQYHALLDQLKRKRQQERAERRLPISQAHRDGAREQPFVGHLLEIKSSDEVIDLAIGSYLRHMTESFRLILEGDYTAPDFDDFFDELHGRWKVIKVRLLRTAKRDSLETCEHGQELLDQTTLTGFKGSLAGRKTIHPYFTCGAYHRLADEGEVWWHPTHNKKN